jgi:hypothetical protein
MNVLLSKLNATVTKFYGRKPNFQSNNGIRFALKSTSWRVNVSILMFEKEPATEATETQYGIGISFVFVALDGTYIDLAEIPRGQTLEFCHQLQRIADWSTVNVLDLDDGQVIFELYRAINLTELDLDRTVRGHHDAELKTALDTLTVEYVLLYPLIVNYSQGLLKTFKHIGRLIEEPLTPQLM